MLPPESPSKSRRSGKSPGRRTYAGLGTLLKDSRKTSGLSVESIAMRVGVKPNFVYLVEKGLRKPKDGHFSAWARAYRLPEKEMWKCVDRIPMDFVDTLRQEPRPSDPFARLTEFEKRELLPFLEYIRWKGNRRDNNPPASPT